MSRGLVLAILLVLVLVLVGGSALYWVGEGRPGTPEEFRREVEGYGLQVEWTNNGPSGGSGVVATECGGREVSISKSNEDGGFRISWAGGTDRLTARVARQIVECSS